MISQLIKKTKKSEKKDISDGFISGSFISKTPCLTRCIYLPNNPYSHLDSRERETGSCTRKFVKLLKRWDDLPSNSSSYCLVKSQFNNLNNNVLRLLWSSKRNTAPTKLRDLTKKDN